MTQIYTPTPPATSAASGSLPWVPLAAWAATTVLALSFVLFLGTNAPYADEWEFVPALVGEEPRLPWLWEQHNEHRMPLPRLVVLAYFTLTHDFRAGMILQVIMLSALALYLIRLAAKVRGSGHWADAFFPISLLHTGHWENFVMGYQVCFVLFAVLATALVVTALNTTRASAFRSGVFAGILLMLLALTGGSGLAVAPAVSAWLLYLTAIVWRSGSKGRALLISLLAVLPFAYLGVYFIGYHRPAHHPEPSLNPLDFGPLAGQVVAVSFGMGLSKAWWAVFPALLALGSGTLLLLKKNWKDADARPAAVGLVAVTAGVTGVAVAIGVGRAGFGGEMGLWSRYSLLTWPLLGAAYLVWAKAARKWVPIALCVAAALAFPGNVGDGMVNGAKIAGDYSQIATQAKAGLTAEQIVRGEAFANSHQAGQTERAVRAIPLLRHKRIGIFAR